MRPEYVDRTLNQNTTTEPSQAMTSQMGWPEISRQRAKEKQPTSARVVTAARAAARPRACGDRRTPRRALSRVRPVNVSHSQRLAKRRGRQEQEAPHQRGDHLVPQGHRELARLVYGVAISGDQRQVETSSWGASSQASVIWWTGVEADRVRGRDDEGEGEGEGEVQRPRPAHGGRWPSGSRALRGPGGVWSAEYAFLNSERRRRGGLRAIGREVDGWRRGPRTGARRSPRAVRPTQGPAGDAAELGT